MSTTARFFLGENSDAVSIAPWSGKKEALAVEGEKDVVGGVRDGEQEVAAAEEEASLLAN